MLYLVVLTRGCESGFVEGFYRGSWMEHRGAGFGVVVGVGVGLACSTVVGG